jgi:hypothetical protein
LKAHEPPQAQPWVPPAREPPPRQRGTRIVSGRPIHIQSLPREHGGRPDNAEKRMFLSRIHFLLSARCSVYN